MPIPLSCVISQLIPVRVSAYWSFPDGLPDTHCPSREEMNGCLLLNTVSSRHEAGRLLVPSELVSSDIFTAVKEAELEVGLSALPQ